MWPNQTQWAILPCNKSLLWLSHKKYLERLKGFQSKNLVIFFIITAQFNVYFQLLKNAVDSRIWRPKATISITHMQNRHNIYSPQKDIVMLALRLVKCFVIHIGKTLSKVKRFLLIRRFLLFRALLNCHSHVLLSLIPTESSVGLPFVYTSLETLHWVLV